MAEARLCLASHTSYFNNLLACVQQLMFHPLSPPTDVADGMLWWCVGLLSLLQAVGLLRAFATHYTNRLSTHEDTGWAEQVAHYIAGANLRLGLC